MTQRHKHADVIIAWAEGARIQWYNERKKEWGTFGEQETPLWSDSIQYRVAPPPPPPDVVMYVNVYRKELGALRSTIKASREGDPQNLRVGTLAITFDGASKQVKSAEIVKE